MLDADVAVLIDLDRCCLNRPFDDQNQLVNRLHALHLASALAAGAAWLLTTDKGLLGKMKGDTRIQVADPVDFVRATRGSRDEN